jgi:hypothetical protein
MGPKLPETAEGVEASLRRQVRTLQRRIALLEDERRNLTPEQLSELATMFDVASRYRGVRMGDAIILAVKERAQTLRERGLEINELRRERDELRREIATLDPEAPRRWLSPAR